MSTEVCIVDYGIGNLHSVARAIEACGGRATLTTDPDAVLRADRLVLPGVGAFEPCVRQLHEANLAEPVKDFARSGKPFLGICVGMQLLFDYSTEFGRHAGLGLIPGFVGPIPPEDEAGVRKVPHIGWRPLMLPPERNGWIDTLTDGLVPGEASAYFVHSFSCHPEDRRHRLADVDHGGYQICAATVRDNLTGFQCHPERSGKVGLSILSRFLTS